MFEEEVKIGDKVKLTTGRIVEITKVETDDSGEYFEGDDIENGIMNSFLRTSIVEKVK